MKIAAGNTADHTVVQLFAVLHDSCRLDDWGDPDHGRRAAEYAKTLRGRLFEMDEQDFRGLYGALYHHADGKTTGDVTMGTCWDADRLDLPRVGIIPDPSLMSTEVGRRLAATMRRAC
jgi:uncharacterized protein